MYTTVATSFVWNIWLHSNRTNAGSWCCMTFITTKIVKTVFGIPSNNPSINTRYRVYTCWIYDDTFEKCIENFIAYYVLAVEFYELKYQNDLNIITTYSLDVFQWWYTIWCDLDLKLLKGKYLIFPTTVNWMYF